MMRVRWTANAADDLACIVERIREDNPAAAQRVAQKIYASVAELRKFPHRGRLSLADNTRELVFLPWPYIAVYESSKTKCRCFAFGMPRRTGHSGNDVRLTHTAARSADLPATRGAQADSPTRWPPRS